MGVWTAAELMNVECQEVGLGLREAGNRSAVNRLCGWRWKGSTWYVDLACLRPGLRIVNEG